MTESTTEQDRDCSSLARAALFPKRMHRDAADDSHFPALLQLDLLRSLCLESLPNATPFTIFPRHVLVVRDLATGGTQWNGEPNFKDATSSSFPVIPGHLSVRCTSECNKLLSLPKNQRAFQEPANGSETEIVLCSDRILKSDCQSIKYKGVAKELPPKSFQAVEEVLAHELVKVRRQQEVHDGTNLAIAASTEVEAAKAAECYFSRHTYDNKKQIKKGSRLQTGYSMLPSFIQGWSKSKCISAVATEQLVALQSDLAQNDAKQAVRTAMKHQN